VIKQRSVKGTKSPKLIQLARKCAEKNVLPQYQL